MSHTLCQTHKCMNILTHHHHTHTDIQQTLLRRFMPSTIKSSSEFFRATLQTGRSLCAEKTKEMLCKSLYAHNKYVSGPNLFPVISYGQCEHVAFSVEETQILWLNANQPHPCSFTFLYLFVLQSWPDFLHTQHSVGTKIWYLLPLWNTNVFNIEDTHSIIPKRLLLKWIFDILRISLQTMQQCYLFTFSLQQMLRTAYYPLVTFLCCRIVTF